MPTVLELSERVAVSPPPHPAHHVEDRLLPLKQTVRHPLDPPSTLLMRRPEEGGPWAHREPAPHGEPCAKPQPRQRRRARMPPWSLPIRTTCALSRLSNHRRLVQIDWPGNIDMQWEFPMMRALLIHLAEFARVILHDHRGIGLSSRNVPIPTLETRVSDPRPFFLWGGPLRAHPTLVGFAAPLSGQRSTRLFSRPAGPRNGHAALALARPRCPTVPMGRQNNPWGRPRGDLEAELRDLELWGTERLQYAR